MRKKVFNIFLVILAVLSVFMYTKIFLLSDFGVQKASAQHEDYITVYLLQPEQNNTPLSGQYNFRIRMVSSVRELLDNVHSVRIKAYHQDQELGFMGCLLTRVEDPDYLHEVYWHGLCDTLIFDNYNGIYFEILAFDSAGGVLPLRGASVSDPAPIFGPFIFENTYLVSANLPDGTIGYGTVGLYGELSGDAESVVFDIHSNDGSTVNITLNANKEGGNQMESVWSAVWDSTYVGNGSYTIYFSFTTFDGTERSYIASATVYICNPSWICGEWSECNSVGYRTRTCEDDAQCNVDYNRPAEEEECGGIGCIPNWQCTEWSECINGIQTRTCEDDNDCNVDYDRPPQEQTCDEGGNENTNSEPLSGDPDPILDNEPLQQPIITSPVSDSQFQDPQPTITGESQSGTIVKVYVNGVLNGEAQSNGTFNHRLAEPLSAGNYEVFAIATDPNDSSRVSIESASIIFAILAPTAEMTIPKEGEVIFGSVTLTARIEGQVNNLDFYYDPIASSRTDFLIGSGRPLSNNPNIWEKSWDTTGIESGQYNIYARIVDLAGDNYLSNRVAIIIDHEQQVDEPPQIKEGEDGLVDTDYDRLPDPIDINPHTPDKNVDETRLNEIVDDLVKEGQISQIEAIEIKGKLENIVIEEPKKSGTLAPEKFKIITIENVTPQIGRNSIVFKGIGPPNTVLTIFIYSSPIVVTTKTDASGNFTYMLDKNLLDGEHEIYITITDKTGKIQEKSSPFSFFIRKAQAVSEEEYLRGDVDVGAGSMTLINNYLYLALTIVAFVVVILVGFYLWSRNKKTA